MINEKFKNQIKSGKFIIAFSTIMEEINASIDFDQKLSRQDIDSSLVHAAM